jgi:hypothetical protein
VVSLAGGLDFITNALPNLDNFDRSAYQRDRHAPSHDQTHDLVPRIGRLDSGLEDNCPSSPPHYDTHVTYT